MVISPEISIFSPVLQHSLQRSPTGLTCLCFLRNIISGHITRLLFTCRLKTVFKQVTLLSAGFVLLVSHLRSKQHCGSNSPRFDSKARAQRKCMWGENIQQKKKLGRIIYNSPFSKFGKRWHKHTKKKYTKIPTSIFLSLSHIRIDTHIYMHTHQQWRITSVVTVQRSASEFHAGENNPPSVRDRQFGDSVRFLQIKVLTCLLLYAEDCSSARAIRLSASTRLARPGISWILRWVF